MDYRKRTKTLAKTIKRAYKKFPVAIDYIYKSLIVIWQKKSKLIRYFLFVLTLLYAADFFMVSNFITIYELLCFVITDKKSKAIFKL